MLRSRFILVVLLGLLGPLGPSGCAGGRAAAPASSAASRPAEPEPSPNPAQQARTLPASSGEPGVAVGIHGAVASAEGHASRVGLAVLRSGGNAVDAAIAVAFALAVTHPTAGNLGGGGFMLVRAPDGAANAIDYRETAPMAASRDMYLDAKGNLTRDSVLGARAAGIPGTVAGLALAHARFGSKPWRELILPAIALAQDGHVLDADHAEDLVEAVAAMRAAGFEASAAHYTGPGGVLLKAGERFVQPELAATLRLIAEQGPRAFYEGPLAEALVAAVKQLGGIWAVEDLKRYQAKERAPLVFDYRGYRVISMPPPSSGGIALRQILAGSELLSMQAAPMGSVEAAHLYVEVARRAFADRSGSLGDPDFVQVPVAHLLDAAYIAQRMGDVDRAHATPSDRVAPGAKPPPPEPEHTTHFSVVDDRGMAVANTYTLNTGFGAKVVAGATGVLLNDEMDDFASKPGTGNVYGLVQGEPNAIQPGKRMLSSMTPTIVEKDGKLRAVVGTPGGPTIINTVAEILRNVLDYGQTIDAAVRAPRIHHQWMPDAITLEDGVPPAVEEGLRALGHTTRRRPKLGHADCIEVDPATGGYRAVADVTRGGGEAVAY
jgi:gamma-glutamyltranspeptidase/glutathione hydrolase